MSVTYKGTSTPVLQAEGKILTSTTGTEREKAGQQTSVIQTQKKSFFREDKNLKTAEKYHALNKHTLEKRLNFYSSLNPHFKVVANNFISIYNIVIAPTLRSFPTFRSLWSTYAMLLRCRKCDILSRSC